MFRKKGKKSKNKDKRNGVVREVYNVPDQIDIDLVQQQFDKFTKSLDEDGKPKLTSENALKGMIRSAVRKKWMFSNTKLAFIQSKSIPDYDTNTRRRFKIQCNICKQWFTKTDVDVDHIHGEHKFTELSQAMDWTNSILTVGFSDLQMLCNITCHPIKTLAESQHISFEQATILKKVIAWENDKSIDHKQFLIDVGFKESEVSNKPKRRILYTSHIE